LRGRDERGGAALLGIAAGIRSMTSVAILSWAAARGHVKLPASTRALDRPLVTDALALAALGEYAVDKLPFTPPRTMLPSWAFRTAVGAGSGYVLARAGKGNARQGAVIGGFAAAVSNYASFRVREALIGLGLPSELAGSLGDAAAVLLSLRAVRR